MGFRHHWGPLAVVLLCYLSHHTQFISNNGFQSTALSVVYGVSQGSILGPLLFINDLPLSTTLSKVLLFDNDTKYLKTICSFSDILDLQHDLIALGAWAKKWNLHLNESK